VGFLPERGLDLLRVFSRERKNICQKLLLVKRADTAYGSGFSSKAGVQGKSSHNPALLNWQMGGELQNVTGGRAVYDASKDKE